VQPPLGWILAETKLLGAVKENCFLGPAAGCVLLLGENSNATNNVKASRPLVRARHEPWAYGPW
jgi:hypothetical protein